MNFYPIILEKNQKKVKKVSAMIFRENKLDQICQNNLSVWIRGRIKLEKGGDYFFVNSTSGILTFHPGSSIKQAPSCPLTYHQSFDIPG